MALFQVSVLKKYLKLQDEKIIDKAYKQFTSYFQHPEIQENIRSSKEEQFQATFLNELFVKLLGYTLNPNPSFNLTTEYKNEKNARKADGAILKEDTTIGVIELKGTNTKHLEGIRQQAFDYKANHKGCVYVITSNFEKLRFYINDATEFLEFDLFELNREDFGLLWLCLHKENIFNSLPLKIKEASIVEEEAITKDFYKDYSLFKRELYRDLVRRNAKKLKSIRHSELISESLEDETLQQEISRLEKNVKLNLFKKSQKLIDRFLFIFFAEDRGLLPPNSIHKIIADWNKLKDLDAEMPLYDRFKQYFGYLDSGRKGTDKKAEIFAYNGGLFKPDAILDLLELDDELLYKHTAKLATYDFESQVDVNILGHIFENSLNEIESVNAEIEGGDFDKQKSKRKKDGVFYTPKYITKYIVENTVGKLCEEKKTELGFREEEYFRGRKRRQKDTLEKLLRILDDYRDWLLKLTICDPACGSGAFLNQALDFLIKEHRYIDEMKAKLLGGGIVFSDIENTILENNIYGVDINEESVEIAKLSLWLRTAQPRRKLNNLSSNVKCGNSLIDDKKVAGDKAFQWKKEFPEIFKNGGFDVVIGNPPYGADLSAYKESFFEAHYKSFEYQINSYVLFYEKGIQLTKKLGVLGFITPATFTNQFYFKKIRNIFNNLELLNVTKYFYEVFQDADIGDSVSWLIRNQNNQFKPIQVNWVLNEGAAGNLISKSVEYKDIVNQDGTYNLLNSEINLSKFYSKGNKLEDVADIIVGIKPYQTNKGKPKQTKDIVKNKIFTADKPLDKTYINCIIGKDFYRYRFLDNPSMYLSYGEWLAEPRNIAPFFEPSKIIIRQTSDSIIGTLEKEQRINLNNVYNINSRNPRYSNEFLLGILNSRLLNLIYQSIAQEKGRSFAEVKKVYLKKLPVIFNKKLAEEIENMVIEILELNDKLFYLNSSFSKYLNSFLQNKSTSKKLRSWQKLEFSEFIKELNKSIKKANRERTKEGLEPLMELTKKDEFEWMELFEENKKKAVALQQQIDETDRKIDQMVYELYGLTEEEIEIVENS